MWMRYKQVKRSQRLYLKNVYKCYRCGGMFYEDYMNRVHYQQEGEEELVCDICIRGFRINETM